MNESKNLVAVQYLGPLEKRKDNVLHKRVVWDGPGDVQKVPEEDAEIYLGHKDVWARPEDKVDLRLRNPKGFGSNIRVKQVDDGSTTSALAAYEDQNKPKEPEPVDEEAQAMAVIEAIGQLSADDINLWNEFGAPKSDALSRITGFLVTPDMRDIGWATIKEAMVDDKQPE